MLKWVQIKMITKTTKITPNGVLCLAFNSKISYQEKVNSKDLDLCPYLPRRKAGHGLGEPPAPTISLWSRGPPLAQLPTHQNMWRRGGLAGLWGLWSGKSRPFRRPPSCHRHSWTPNFPASRKMCGDCRLCNAPGWSIDRKFSGFFHHLVFQEPSITHAISYLFILDIFVHIQKNLDL